MPLTRGNYSNKIVQLPVRVQLGRNRPRLCIACCGSQLPRLISERARINSGKSCRLNCPILVFFAPSRGGGEGRNSAEGGNLMGEG